MRGRSGTQTLGLVVAILSLIGCASTPTVTTDPGSAGPDQTTTDTDGDNNQNGTSAGNGETSVSMGMTEPAAIDPALIPDIYGAQVARLTFDGLTSIGSELDAVPAVAESWDTEDNQAWTFQLRDDVTFANGDPVTAESFVTAWNRAAHPDTASPVAYHGLPIVGWADVMEAASEEISGIAAVDDRTLEIQTESPFNLLPKVLAHPVFSPIPDEGLSDPTAFAEAPIGNGMYEIAEPWRHNETINLRRHEGYYGDAGTPDRIEFRLYSEVETAYRDVLAGNLDIAFQSVTPGLLENAEAEFGDRLLRVETGSVNYLTPPTAASPYDQVELRHALSMAIDREALAERIWSGAVTAARGLVPPQAPGAVTDACDPCTYDPEEARRLFEESGWEAGTAMKLYHDSSGIVDDDVEFLANSWRQGLGLETELVPMEFTQVVDLLYEGWDDGLVYIGWIWDYPSPYSFLAPLLESTSGDNVGMWSNAEFDASLEAARTAESEEAGLTHLEEAQRIFAQELPLIPLYFFTDLSVHSQRVSNVTENAMGYLFVEDVQVVGD